MKTITQRLTLLVSAVLCFTTLSAQVDTNRIYWLGTVSTEWNDADNWSYFEDSIAAARVPDANCTVVLSSGATDNCELNVDATVTAIELLGGASLDLQGYELTVSGNVYQNGDSLVCGTGDVTIGDSLLVVSGTFISTSDTLNIGKSFIDYSNSFANSGGVVRFTEDASVLVDQPFYKLIVGDNTTLTMNAKINLLNHLQLNGDINSIGESVLLINSSNSIIDGDGGVQLSPDGSGDIGALIWFASTQTGTYNFPIIPRTGEDIAPTEVTINTAGVGNGVIVVSSLAADSTKPMVLNGDLAFYKADGTSNADNNLNRLWHSSVLLYSTPPEATYTFTYNDGDLAGIDADESRLKAQFIDIETFTWSDMMGTLDTANNTITIANQTGVNGYWVLVDSTSPNAITYGGKTGTSCSNAIDLDAVADLTINTFKMIDDELWFTFSSTSATYELITTSNDSVNLIDSIEVFEGANCGVKTLLFTDTSYSYYISPGFLSTNSVVGFLKINKSVTTTETLIFGKSEQFLDSLDSDSTFAYYNGSSKWENCSLFDANVEEKTVYLNFHFLLRDDGTGNFNETDDGYGDIYMSGYDVARYYVDQLNIWSANTSNFTYRVNGVIQPVTAYPLNLRFELFDDPNDPNDSGVHFHRNSSDYASNPGLSDLESDYSVFDEKVIDIFFIDNPNTVNNSSGYTFLGYHGVVIYDLYDAYESLDDQGNMSNNFWARLNLLRHELMHCMGLVHTSMGGGGTSQCGNSIDNCDDTENISLPGVCDTQCEWSCSNNIMDYGPEEFVTPCQLGIIHRTAIRHPSVSYSCELGSTINITSDIAWNTTRYPTGNVIVKSGNSLRIQCQVFMKPGAKIKVERGAKLHVDGGIITNYCTDSMWGGIEVWGNPSKTHPDSSDIANGTYPDALDDHGVVIIEDESLIENAVNAITTTKNVTWTPGHDVTYNGGIVIALNSTFRNNQRSIEFMQFIKGGIYYDNNISAIDNCTFETTRELNGSRSPTSHITMWDVRGVDVRNNYFVNTDLVYFYTQQRGNGITTIDATANIVGNVFEDLYSGLNIGATSFRLGSTITEDTIIDCTHGIVLNGNIIPTVFNNRIDASNSRYHYIDGSHGLVSGIINIGNIIPRIDENEIVLPSSYSYGIYSIATGTFPYEIFANEIEGTQSSYAFPNSLYNPGLILKCNDVLDEMDHILVFNYGEIAEDQGNCSGIEEPAGNLFFSSCSFGSSPHLYAELTSEFFRYNHHNIGTHTPNSGCRVNETNVYDVNNCNFTLQPGEDPCPNRTSGGGGGGGDIFEENTDVRSILEVKKDLLDNSRTNDLIKDIQDISGVTDAELMDSLLSTNGKVSDDALIALLYERSIDSSDLGHLLILNAPHSNRFWKAFRDNGQPIPTDSLTKLEQYQDSTNSRTQIIDTISILRRQLVDNYSQLIFDASSDTALSYSDIIDSMALEDLVHLRFLLADMYMADSQYSQAGLIYDSLVVYESSLVNLLELREIEHTFKSNAWNWFELTGEGSATAYEDSIRDIATRDTSSAAIQAQVILNLVFGDTLLQVWEWKGSGSSKRGIVDKPEVDSSLEEKSAKFLVYPNPVYDELHVEYQTESKNEKLVLYSLMGKIVKVVELPPNSMNVAVSLQDIPNGTYIYKVEGAVSSTKTGKIVILR